MSSYNKQPESVLSRSNPTWYFFPITIFYIKCMDLTTWSTCKSLYINSSFCTCQSQVLYLLYLHLPFANTHVVKYHGPSMHGTLAILKPAQQSRCYQCHISDVQNPLLVIDFARLSELWSTNQYIAIRWILNLRCHQSNLRCHQYNLLLIWIVYVNRCLAHWLVNNG